jgi:hypothetical protein
MKFNTKAVTNIYATKEFVGRFAGVDLPFAPGQTRYLPSHIADHVGKQLAEEVYKSQSRKNPKLVESVEQILSKILGKEIITKDDDRELSVSDLIAQHEDDYARYAEEKHREEVLRQAENA